MKFALLLLAMTLLGACATSPKRIACDRHLVPINPPTTNFSQPGHTP